MLRILVTEICDVESLSISKQKGRNFISLEVGNWPKRSHVTCVMSPAGMFNRLWWSKSEFHSNRRREIKIIEYCRSKFKRALLFLCLQYLNPLHRLLVTVTCILWKFVKSKLQRATLRVSQNHLKVGFSDTYDFKLSEMQ